MGNYQYDHINIAVSSCLAGEAVRYDGTAKSSSIITNQFFENFSMQTVCPEMAIGLGVPRKPIKLVVDKYNSSQINLIDKEDSSLNHTDKMLSIAKQYCNQFNGFCGYVVKEDSPSCGLLSTARYSISNTVVSRGAGIFTEQIMVNLPWLPILSEQGLESDKMLDNFLERIFILHLWLSIKNNNKLYDKFTTCIQHQLELRGIDLSIVPMVSFDSDLKEKNNYITKIMTILKSPITVDRQIIFLQTNLNRYNIKSQKMTTIIPKYLNHEISLWDVIQLFQLAFKNNNLRINSNYFYPDIRERKCRVFYFGK